MYIHNPRKEMKQAKQQAFICKLKVGAVNTLTVVTLAGFIYLMFVGAWVVFGN